MSCAEIGCLKAESKLKVRPDSSGEGFFPGSLLPPCGESDELILKSYFN